MARSEKNLNAVFTDTAEAIRVKTNTTEKICPLDFADKIFDINTAGPGGDALKEYIADGGRFGGSQINYFYKYDHYLRNVSDLSSAFTNSFLRAIPNIDFTNVSTLTYAFSGCDSMSFDHVTSIVDGNPVFAKSKIVIRDLVGSCARAFANCHSLGYVDCDITTKNPPSSCDAMFDSAWIRDVNISLTDIYNLTYMFVNVQTADPVTTTNYYDFNSFSLKLNFTDPKYDGRLDLTGMFMSCQMRHAPLFKIPDGFMVRNYITMDYFLAYDQYLEVVPEYDLFYVNSLTGFVDGCYALSEFKAKGIRASLDLSQSNFMTHDTIIPVLRNLAATDGQTLTLGPTYLAMLSDEEKAIATDKGWTLA